MANGIAQREPDKATGRATAPSAARKRARPQDDGVWWVKHEIKCRACGTKVGKNGFLQRKSKRWLCLACAGLSHLTFLPRGDVALTRRATKHSSMYAIVVRRVRGRLERKGMLVEAEALQQAIQECQADADVREEARAKAAVRRAIIDERYLREFTERLGELFPGCPADERKSIAEHTCEKYSGRIGRSAAAVRFDPEAIRVAVHAHIRHTHTHYDELLKAGKTRKRARSAVHKAVKQLAEKWRGKGA